MEKNNTSTDIYEYLLYTVNLIAKSEFSNKFVVKGGMSLMSRLRQCDSEEMGRFTRDIDLHCNSMETWNEFCTRIEEILNHNDRGYIYRVIKRRSDSKPSDTSDSLELTLTYGEKIIKFKIDMNVKYDSIIEVEYSHILNMNVYDVYTQLSDKIVVVSSQSIFRRIKDLYDTDVLLRICNIKYSAVIDRLYTKHPDAVLCDMLTPSNYEALRHAYDKYSGIKNKTDIRNLIAGVKEFLMPIYGNFEGDLIWNSQLMRWEKI